MRALIVTKAVAAALVSGCAVPSSHAPLQAFEELSLDLGPVGLSVVTIEVVETEGSKKFSSVATGVVYARDETRCIVITAAHALADKVEEIRVTPWGTNLPARLATRLHPKTYVPIADVAAIAYPADPYGCPILRSPKATGPVTLGQPVLAYGSLRVIYPGRPQAIETTVSAGVITGLVPPDGRDGPSLISSAATPPGFSGGPVLFSDGSGRSSTLVGITSAMLGDANNPKAPVSGFGNRSVITPVLEIERYLAALLGKTVAVN
ncbi:MAG: trypsin-like peptidase domain-containing protein [Thiobacillus sp.]|nr:trypsin-like peptidase domain-containing protein [Thiobacillus sp.]